MGIEAFCPNGHRINVKKSLAGHTGLCPTCGAKFRIPLAEAEPATSAAGLPPARLLDLPPDVIAQLPRVLPYAMPVEPSAPPPVFSAPPPPAAAPRSFEQPPPPQPVLHPVLAERPDLTWCIAFPGGDPTEPLSAESMQAWLESGQVEGGEVVWRSDWPEWRPAREVFPDVQG